MKYGQNELQSTIDAFMKDEVEEPVDNSIDDSMENFEIDLDIRINRMMSLKDAKQMVERELITRVMNKVRSTYKAARILEVSQATIARKYKRYNDEISFER